ncbi:MAG: M4 family metallopeptidase [Verrucomicrobia bacterium]|nr:M4 family metallopeptidase [Verrucomicrobiota bacterium]
MAHGKLFGVTSSSVDFKLRKKNSGQGRHSIRLTQTYEGIPVFGGETVVQVNDAGGVEYVSGNFDRDTSDLDEKRLSIKPKLTADEAAAAAQAHYAPKAAGQVLAVTPPELALFVPALLKLNGPRRLTWKMDVRSADEWTVAQLVFIDAHSGAFVLDIPLIHHAINRLISDAALTTASPGTLVRSENGPESHIADADAAYDQLGDVYNFYFNHFNRDGITGTGAALRATVRWREVASVPYPNAYWSGIRMVFGEGYVVDDITAHEMTHGVTASTSALINLNESGAINESMSDVFGEFVDLTNGKGTDTASMRWLIGEDMPSGASRSMKDPPSVLQGGYGSPDWRGSQYYLDPTSPILDNFENHDNGGVHFNSGVNNKLCYLLTDGTGGGTFRTHTITGMGIDPVAALYYEANVKLLGMSSGWDDLSGALRRAAINKNWSISERENLDNALAAVGILTPPPLIYINEMATGTEAGTPEQPAHSIARGVSLLGTEADGTFFLKGTGHSTRIERRVSIRAWNGPEWGPARIAPIAP